MSFTLPNIIKVVTGKMNKKSDLARVQSFIERHPKLGVASEAFQQALENINTNIRWMDKNYKKIDDWLQSIEKPGWSYF